MKNLAVLGQGYVGLQLALRAAACGYDVVGFDVDEERIARLVGVDPFVTDVSAESLAGALASGCYRPTPSAAAIGSFDVAVIAVPTPLTDGRPDLSAVESAAQLVAKHLRRGALVVLESTSYPGTTEEVVLPLLEEGSGLVAGTDFFLAYSPERIDPGNTSWTFRTTPKLVAGIDSGSLRAASAFYSTLVDRVVPVAGTAEAELAKLLENTFRHVNIALVNEMAVLAADLGIDIWEVVDAASTKPFGFMRFEPGPGVGGHCLPIDPVYLAWQVRRRLGRPFRFAELAGDVNAGMARYVVDRLARGLDRCGRSLRGSRVLLLGVAYKANVGDPRESPALALAALLEEAGAEVAAADPRLTEPLTANLRLVEASASELAAADAVVLVTDHDDFDLDLVARCARYVLDTRHRLPASPCVEHL
jgi:UDP-N-acetyl-D-glucosamine dehydrogenase